MVSQIIIYIQKDLLWLCIEDVLIIILKETINLD